MRIAVRQALLRGGRLLLVGLSLLTSLASLDLGLRRAGTVALCLAAVHGRLLLKLAVPLTAAHGERQCDQRDDDQNDDDDHDG